MKILEKTFKKLPNKRGIEEKISLPTLSKKIYTPKVEILLEEIRQLNNGTLKLQILDSLIPELDD
ncbi:MAG: hypothetical protein QM493_07925 [Sulfurovum sp.]